MTYGETYNEIRALMDRVTEVRYSDLAEERRCCLRLLELAEAAGDHYAEAFAHTYLGDHYVAAGDSIRCSQHLLYARRCCTDYHFDDLLLVNCLLSGVLCENITNPQKAFDHYMEGIALADRLRDGGTKGNIYNNIASNFALLGDHGEAVKYYQRASRLFALEGVRVSARCRVALLGNLAESYCALGRLDDARRCLDEADGLADSGGVDGSVLYIAKVYLAVHTRPEAVRGLVEELLALHLEQSEDINFVFEVLCQVGSSAVEAGEKACAQQIVETLEGICDETQILHVQQLQTLRVELWELCHGGGDDDDAYRRYYRAMRSNEKNSREVWAAGLKAKIGLAETMREKEAAQAHSRVLEAEVYLDEVSQVYNRRYLNHLLEEAGQVGQPRQVCAVMIDLDYFKEFNDTYGHLSGDLALRTVAACLCENAPEGTVVGRYGGDEYMVLRFDAADREIEAYLEAVRRDLSQRAVEHRNSRRGEKVLTLSMGYCNAQVQGPEGYEWLVLQADRALYMSKYKGRNGITRAQTHGALK